MIFNFATRWPHLLQFHTWNGDPAWKLTVYFNVKMIRGYHAYKSYWFTVTKQLPCQREQANSKDPSQLRWQQVSWSLVTKNSSASSTRLQEFLEEEFFTSSCLVTKIMKISTLWKFPAIWYTSYYILHVLWCSMGWSVPSHTITTSVDAGHLGASLSEW